MFITAEIAFIFTSLFPRPPRFWRIKKRIESVSWREPFSVLFAPVISAAGRDFIHPKEYLRPVGDRFAGGLTLLNPIQTSGRNVRAETPMKRTCSWPRALVTDQSLRVIGLNHVMFMWVLKGKISFIVFSFCFIGTTGSHLSLTQTCYGFTTLPTKCWRRRNTREKIKKRRHSWRCSWDKQENAPLLQTLFMSFSLKMGKSNYNFFGPIWLSK